MTAQNHFSGFFFFFKGNTKQKGNMTKRHPDTYYSIFFFQINTKKVSTMNEFNVGLNEAEAVGITRMSPISTEEKLFIQIVIIQCNSNSKGWKTS